MPVSEWTRRVGISEPTFCYWRMQCAGLEPHQVREFKQLQEENARLKRLVAALSLDKAFLQDVAKRKVGRPALKRDTVASCAQQVASVQRDGLRPNAEPFGQTEFID